MCNRFFTDEHRPVHTGGFPLERLARVDALPDLNGVPAFSPLEFDVKNPPKASLTRCPNIQTMMDAIQGGN